LLVRASPKSSREGIAGVVETPQGPALAVRVRAAAQKGEANHAIGLAVAALVLAGTGLVFVRRRA